MNTVSSSELNTRLQVDAVLEWLMEEERRNEKESTN